MANPTRIYLVSSTDGDERHLVRAQLPSQAERYVARQRYKARVPTQDELIELASQGAPILTADADADAA